MECGHVARDGGMDWPLDRSRPRERIWEPEHRPPAANDGGALAKKLVPNYVHNSQNVGELVRYMREQKLSLL